MSNIFDLVIPALILGVSVFALYKKVDVYTAITDGAAKGLRVVIKIFPALVGLLTAVYMFQASGAMDALSDFFAPALETIGIPKELASLIFIRPISGSGALAVGSEIITEYGVDSLIGVTAAVMLGSTETTFYTVAVYFGAVGIRKTRWAIPAALCADFVGFFVAALTVRLLFFS